MIKKYIDSFMFERCSVVPSDRAPELEELGYQARIAGGLMTRSYFGTGEAPFALSLDGLVVERKRGAPQHGSEVYLIEKSGLLSAVETKL